ncbi:hypothetical protein EZS27_016426 [termite gut metagenome]|uniref:Lcl C-terminal domain-containing protein n=1 Tax=termite gut metagenome TaxID=433724 RepID=A0A5J4RMP2_9ZZZZ
MKKILLLGILATVTLWSCKEDDKPQPQLTVSIGESYEGGVVFYIAADKQSGLVAAPNDQSEAIAWSSKRKVIPTNNEIGTGQENTTTIIKAKASDNDEYAAKLCNDLVLGGYDDWYLPSIEELIELYKQKDKLGGFDASATYWSSSALDGGYPNAGYTWTYIFRSDNPNQKNLDLNQHALYKVRAIRTILGTPNPGTAAQHEH